MTSEAAKQAFRQWWAAQTVTEEECPTIIDAWLAGWDARQGEVDELVDVLEQLFRAPVTQVENKPLWRKVSAILRNMGKP